MKRVEVIGRAHRAQVVLTTTLVVTAIVSAGPAAATSPSTRQRSQNVARERTLSELRGVSADSTSDAWAVGDYQDETGGPVRTLTLHWNGHVWSKVASPNPSGITDHLTSVSALSPTDAWAVGSYVIGSSDDRTLILHWDGNVWSQVASPNVGPLDNELNGVSAVSSNDVWAVGANGDTATHYWDTLTLHWDGVSWSHVDSPNPATTNWLGSVSAVSSDDAWAVGQVSDFTSTETLALHWDGSAWSRAETPNTKARTNRLAGVTAPPGADALTVGALTLRTVGGAWRRVKVHVPSKSFDAVSADSPEDAWAVGTYEGHAFTAHWNGRVLTRVHSPSPGMGSGLAAASAVSPTEAWAVGTYDNRRAGSWDTLVLHWNGLEWAMVKSPNGSLIPQLLHHSTTERFQRRHMAGT